MVDPWIWLGFLGGAFQAFRIAGQRLVSVPLSAGQRPPSLWASPLSRVLVGVPLSAIALLLALRARDVEPAQLIRAFDAAFVAWIVLAAGLQLVATIVQTALVKRRNFAIGIVYLKIMVPAQAVLGVVLFGERFGPYQWLALGVVTVGVGVLGQARTAGASAASAFDWTGLWMGLGAGVVLALTGLFVREANVALPIEAFGPVVVGMASLLVLATLQLLACGVAIAWRDRGEFRDLARRWRLVGFTGLMSVSGSACWFVGFALASPALVNAVGQSEFLFAMLLSLCLFGERPSRSEWIGMSIVMLGIVLLLLS